MTAIKVSFEIGHKASMRTKQTPEGFTHDWEVFVRGQEDADISHFVDKVVFLLHETFPKPKRVVKEPPFSIKESGYAGFIFPIEIYLKNRDEPKKIKFTYDLTLQHSGCLKDRFVFQNPNDDFKKKLLKGGGIYVNHNAFYTNPDQESRSRDSFTEDKQQLVSKPKLSSDAPPKKHKSKEHKEEIPLKTSSFENLFGPPIHKPPKVSPEPKKLDKNATVVKTEKKDKERSDKDKVKTKHEHKEAKPEKVKSKEDKEKLKSEKVKSHKDAERSKEKSNKRPSERPISPEPPKKRVPSPSRRPPSPPRRLPSPPTRSSSATSIKEEYKPPKPQISEFEHKRREEKLPESKPEKEVKEKKKKDKKSHDRDKERKDKKEHKKESHKSKESLKEPPKEVPKEIPKPKEVVKEKEPVKEISVVKEKSSKSEKPVNKFSIENLKKTPQDIADKFEEQKVKEKGDSEKKHKHKKKDKKKDESRERHKDSSKEKKHKHDKVREVAPEKPELIERRETPVPKEKPVPELASPISIDTASQCSSKSGIAKTSQIGAEDINSSHSDSEESVAVEDEAETKVKIEIPSPEPPKERVPSPEPEPVPEIEPEPDPAVEPPQQQKEKSKKHKDKSSKREEKRRKRKAAEEDDESRKAAKTETVTVKTESEQGESSGTTSAETKVQDNGVSSSLGEDAEPGEMSPNYMEQLRELQKRIMTIKSNEELERVVNLIAETGRYEVTTKTFDFDLCLLDRATVLQLIEMVSC